MNRDYSINLKLWGSLLALVALSSGIGLYTASTAVDRFTGARANSIAQNDRLSQYGRQQALERARIETEADRTQAKIDNNINVFDSVTLPDYTCDADNPPVFDHRPYVDPTGAVKVSDRNQRIIGFVSFTGEFVFEPEGC